MSCRRIFRSFFILLVAFFLSTPIYSKTQPKFTIVPMSKTTWDLPINGAITITYQVTNKTHITRTLIMKPIAGITQNTVGSGYCGNPFTLASGQSCLLVLPIVGSQIAGQHITEGPVICKTKGSNDNSPDLFLCSQSSRENSLNITSVGSELANISVSPQRLSLTAGGSPNSLIITNNSQTVTALNIQDQFPGGLPVSWGDVSLNPTLCNSIAPGATCTLTFTPGTSLHEGEQFIFQGSNTTSTIAVVSVSGMADISVSPTSLGLVAGAPYTPQNVTVTNNSTTTSAFGVKVYLPRTLDVTVSYSGGGATCPTIAPNGGTCTVTFTPKDALYDAPPLTEFYGTNTSIAEASISVVYVGATIKFYDSNTGTLSETAELVLQPGSSKVLAIKNVSYLPVTTGAISDDASTAVLPAGAVTSTNLDPNCAALPQGQICHIQFTSSGPLSTKPPATYGVSISAPNTNTLTANASVSDAVLQLSTNELFLATQGIFTQSSGAGVLGGTTPSKSRTITLTNTGTITATGISCVVTIAPASQMGSTITGCPTSLDAGASQVLTISPATQPSEPAGSLAAPNTLTVSANNAHPVTASIYVLTYGNHLQNGVIYSIDDSANSNLGGKVVAKSPLSPVVQWDSNPSCASFTACAVTNATDLKNGISNTNTIISVLGSAPYMEFYSSFSAGACDLYNKGGYTWYLPAICELAPDLSMISGCGSIARPAIQNIASNAMSYLPLMVTAEAIYSSTEYSQYYAWGVDTNKSNNILLWTDNNYIKNLTSAGGVAYTFCAHTF